MYDDKIRFGFVVESWTWVFVIGPMTRLCCRGRCAYVGCGCGGEIVVKSVINVGPPVAKSPPGHHAMPASMA